MAQETTTVTITRIDDGHVSTVQDTVVKEVPLTIFLNDEELSTLICSPNYLKELVVGFLASEGILQSLEDLKSIMINESDGLAWVETTRPAPAAQMFLKRYVTTCCGRGRASFYFINDARNMQFIESKLQIHATQVLDLSRRLEEATVIFSATGGTHGAALCTPDGLELVFEDIGRHNAIDKIFGRCFLQSISTTDKLLLFSGRISSEIILKVARMKIPILISVGAPTDLALELAAQLGITVIGFARGKRMNIYTHAERIK